MADYVPIEAQGVHSSHDDSGVKPLYPVLVDEADTSIMSEDVDRLMVGEHGIGRSSWPHLTLILDDPRGCSFEM